MSQAVEVNDVVQLAAHPDVRDLFWGKLGFVDEVKGWGIRVRIETFEGDAYYRAAWGQFARIGKAAFVSVDSVDNNIPTQSQKETHDDDPTQRGGAPET